MAEAKLNTLRDEQAVRTCQLDEQQEKLKTWEAALIDRDAELGQAAQEQVAERSRLGKLKEEADRAQESHAKLASEEKDGLEAREKSLAVVE